MLSFRFRPVTPVRRHRKILRVNIQGVTKPAIRRLSRRGAKLGSALLLSTHSTLDAVHLGRVCGLLFD